MIDVALQNAWILYEKSVGKLFHRAFREKIAQTYFTRYGVSINRTMPLLLSHSRERKRVVDELQHDGIDHYLTETLAKSRRRCAGFNFTKRVSIQCCKCDVGLCLGCNLSYLKK